MPSTAAALVRALKVRRRMKAGRAAGVGESRPAGGTGAPRRGEHLLRWAGHHSHPPRRWKLREPGGDGATEEMSEMGAGSDGGDAHRRSAEAPPGESPAAARRDRAPRRCAPAGLPQDRWLVELGWEGRRSDCDGG